MPGLRAFRQLGIMRRSEIKVTGLKQSNMHIELELADHLRINPEKRARFSESDADHSRNPS